ADLERAPGRDAVEQAPPRLDPLGAVAIVARGVRAAEIRAPQRELGGVGRYELSWIPVIRDEIAARVDGAEAARLEARAARVIVGKDLGEHGPPPRPAGLLDRGAAEAAAARVGGERDRHPGQAFADRVDTDHADARAAVLDHPDRLALGGEPAHEPRG